MSQKIIDMQTALELLEFELKAVNWWEKEAPSQEALSSTEPFCIDFLTFSQWLQWVYIPKMHEYMLKFEALPTASGLLPIAEEAWKNTKENKQSLLTLVEILDNIVLENEYQSQLFGLIDRQNKQ